MGSGSKASTARRPARYLRQPRLQAEGQGAVPDTAHQVALPTVRLSSIERGVGLAAPPPLAPRPVSKRGTMPETSCHKYHIV